MTIARPPHFAEDAPLEPGLAQGRARGVLVGGACQPAGSRSPLMRSLKLVGKLLPG